MNRRDFVKTITAAAASLGLCDANKVLPESKPPRIKVKPVPMPQEGLYPGKIIPIDTMHDIELWHEREHRYAREASELRAVLHAIEEKEGIMLGTGGIVNAHFVQGTRVNWEDIRGK